jgi:hypothetical protein
MCARAQGRMPVSVWSRASVSAGCPGGAETSLSGIGAASGSEQHRELRRPGRWVGVLEFRDTTREASETPRDGRPVERRDVDGYRAAAATRSFSSFWEMAYVWRS